MEEKMTYTFNINGKEYGTEIKKNLLDYLFSKEFYKQPIILKTYAF